jgi:hypothetical protein
MKCPKCGFEQPDGRPDCQACGIIFTKWHGGGPPRHHAAAEPPPLPAGPPDIYEPSPEPIAPASTPRAGLFPGLALLAAAGLAAWWINFSKGRALAEGAYRDPDGRFAITPPPGWLTLSAANFQQVMGEMKDRFPPAMRQYMDAGRVAVAFFQLTDQDGSAPNFNVVVTPRPSRGLGEAERQEIVEVLSREFGRLVPGYRVESSRLLEVDGLEAVYILGQAPENFLPGMPSARGGLRMEQIMVRGNRHAFNLSCAVEAAVVEQHAACEAMFNSFRDLGPRFGPVLTWGLNGGLIGLALAALKMVVGG